MLDTITLLSVERVAARRHRIRVFVPTCPDLPADRLAHYRGIAELFAVEHSVRLLPGLDFDPTPMRESGVLSFDVKEWKDPTKRAAARRAAGRPYARS